MQQFFVSLKDSQFLHKNDDTDDDDTDDTEGIYFFSHARKGYYLLNLII